MGGGMDDFVLCISLWSAEAFSLIIRIIRENVYVHFPRKKSLILPRGDIYVPPRKRSRYVNIEQLRSPTRESYRCRRMYTPPYITLWRKRFESTKEIREVFLSFLSIPVKSRGAAHTRSFTLLTLQPARLLSRERHDGWYPEGNIGDYPLITVSLY